MAGWCPWFLSDCSGMRKDCRLRSSRRFLCVHARNVGLRPLQRSFLLACLACVCLVEASFGRGGKVGWIFCGCPWLCLCTTNTACSVGAGNPFDARLRVWASFGQRSVFAGRCSRGCWSLRFQGMCASALLCMSSRFFAGMVHSLQVNWKWLIFSFFLRSKIFVAVGRLAIFFFIVRPKVVTPTRAELFHDTDFNFTFTFPSRTDQDRPGPTSFQFLHVAVSVLCIASNSCMWQSVCCVLLSIPACGSQCVVYSF